MTFHSREIGPQQYASWIFCIIGMWAIIHLGLLAALLAGLLIYELVHLFLHLFSWRLTTHRAKLAAVTVVILLVVACVTSAGFGLVAFLRHEGSLPLLLDKMAEILEDSRAHMPLWLDEALPDSAAGISQAATGWLRTHAAEFQEFGKETAHFLARLLVGMVIGAMVSLHEVLETPDRAPLANALKARMYRLGEAFRNIVFAQVRISALNTFLTSIYLIVVLPISGVHLPLTKTMIVVTFIAGLLPVVGNLISNSVIFIISLSHSSLVALSSLSFLVFVHKLEYFLNARIVGRQINATAWELLTAMLLMESLFGISGLVAAPICYAWLKNELKAYGQL